MLLKIVAPLFILLLGCSAQSAPVPKESSATSTEMARLEALVQTASSLPTPTATPAPVPTSQVTPILVAATTDPALIGCITTLAMVLANHVHLADHDTPTRDFRFFEDAIADARHSMGPAYFPRKLGIAESPATPSDLLGTHCASFLDAELVQLLRADTLLNR